MDHWVWSAVDVTGPLWKPQSIAWCTAADTVNVIIKTSSQSINQATQVVSASVAKAATDVCSGGWVDAICLALPLKYPPSTALDCFYCCGG